MTDQNDIDDKSDATNAEAASICGGRLAEARRAKKIPILDIAKELHLDEYKVRALENNDFDVLGAPVFAKGHLRKYAQLVGVDDGEIVNDFNDLTATMDAPQFVSLRKRPHREMSPMPWVLAIAMLLVIAALYWWFAVREPTVDIPTDTIFPASEIEEANEDSAVNVVDSDAVSSTIDAAENVDLELPDAEPVATAVVLPAQPVDNTELRITLSFSGACWTEISDADGRRLFFELGENGRNVTLTGKAPVNVLFGNAANVTLTVNGDAHAIENVDRRGTSRMTLNAT